MRNFIITLILFASAIAFCSCNGPYYDGIYEGRSQAKYTNEPFVGVVKLEIKKGHISSVEYMIIDTLANEVFDETYEKHYAGNEKYIQQCRNDWKGVNAYPSKLLKMQDIVKIDAISGATWSCNIFKQSALEALKKAQK